MERFGIVDEKAEAAKRAEAEVSCVRASVVCRQRAVSVVDGGTYGFCLCCGSSCLAFAAYPARVRPMCVATEHGDAFSSWFDNRVCLGPDLLATGIGASSRLPLDTLARSIALSCWKRAGYCSDEIHFSCRSVSFPLAHPPHCKG